jgi:hypothetical protein
MNKSRDILEKKAQESESLKASVKNKDKSSSEYNEVSPKTVINEEGKEVLVFSDPLHSREKRSVVNYSIFRGKWEFENIDDLDETDQEKCAVKFKPVKDNSSLTIAFKSLKDRVEFIDSIYSDSEMKQMGGGINLEKFANSKVLQTTGGIIGLSIAAYGLYKLFKGKKEKISQINPSEFVYHYSLA